MTRKEFVDKEFYIYCKQEYEKARNFLKNCGKPKDSYDIGFIKFNRDTCEIFKAYK